MKSNVFIVSLVAVFLISLTIGGFFLVKNYNDKKTREKEALIEEKLIENTEAEFAFYLNKEIISASGDLTKNIMNEVNLEQEKNNAIDFVQFYKKLLVKQISKGNIENFIDLINEEIAKYSLDCFAEFKDEYVYNTISDRFHKDTVVSIFKQHDFIQNMNNEIEKRENYITSLNSLKNDLEIVSKNNNYYIEDNEYFYKSSDALSVLKHFSDTYSLNLKISKEPFKVPILCYHGVLDEPWGIESLFVKVSSFEEQMKYLSEQGYTSLFVSEIKSAINYEKPVIITFDDGYVDVYNNAFPILKKYNIKANVFMISGWINGDVYMTSDMTKEMASSSLIEIGSHTINHSSLASLSNEEIEKELLDSKTSLEELISKQVSVVAYPKGSYDSRVINIASKYYDYALSTVSGKENPLKLNTYSLKRLYVYRNYGLAQFKSLLN